MIAGVLLAAGNSERFGGDKLHHVMADGRTVGQAAAQSLRTAAKYCVAVVPHDNARRAQLFAEVGFEIAYAPTQPFGMGVSLACAVRALTPCDGIVVALADMPFVNASTIALLHNALASGASIVVPYYRGVRGHPVGFSARWRAELEALRGDVGARSLLRRYASEVVRVDCADEGVLVDIDRRADLECRVDAASAAAAREQWPVRNR